jgi:hypothetical protein
MALYIVCQWHNYNSQNNLWCCLGISTGSISFSYLYNNLPNTVNNKTIPILFANDTTILVKSPNIKDFHTNMVTAFNCVKKWFKVNLLSINANKTHYIQF